MIPAGRRRVLLALGGLLLLAAARAQGPARAAHLAILSDSAEDVTAPRWRFFYDRLRELGYAEGRNLRVSARYSKGDRARLPALAAELVALQPDLIVCITTPATLAAKRASSTLPIVFIGAAEPVETGLVASLARPGGNVTGTSITSADMAGKWIEILTELAPRARRFAFLGQEGNASIAVVFGFLKSAAAARGASVRLLDATSASQVERAFAAMSAEKVDAFIVASHPLILSQRRQLVELAEKHRLPALYARDEYLEAGGLMSYGPDRNAYYRRSAEYVHRILEGTRAADLPVEQPAKFDLAINLKTAKALGLTVPQSLLLRADRVIQ